MAGQKSAISNLDRLYGSYMNIVIDLYTSSKPDDLPIRTGLAEGVDTATSTGREHLTEIDRLPTPHLDREPD
jgi:hypothetical protein